MTAELRFHRMTTVLLITALLATLTVALTGGQPAGAVDGPVDLVYVATGRNFPDALAGANLAATVGAPMLTVEPDLPVPDATVTALRALDPDRIVVFGGPAAVSQAVRGALVEFARSGSVTRIEGFDRHATAAAIADALPGKVHDADRIDGLDSSAFLRTSERDRLETTVYEGERQHATTFVRLPDTATNADAALTIFEGPEVPAGAYVATGQVGFKNGFTLNPANDTAYSNPVCRLTVGGATTEAVAAIGVADAGMVARDTVPLHLTAHLDSPATPRLVCWATGVQGNMPEIWLADVTKLILVRVGR